MGAKENQLLREGSLLLFDKSQALAEFASVVLRDARRKLEGSILEVSGTDLEQSVTVQAQRQLMRELDEHLASAKASLENHARGEFERVVQLQFEGLVEQVNLFNQASKTGLSLGDLSKMRGLTPRVSGNLIKSTLEGSLKLLSENAHSVREPIRRILAQNVLTGNSFRSAVKDIVGTGINKGVFRTVEDRAQVIAITETTNVYNTARFDSLDQINAKLAPEKRLKMKWLALIDGRTSGVCRALHGQVRRQGEKFVSETNKGGNGKSYLMPAAHPRCRSQVVPYREEWDEIFADLERDLARRVKKRS